MPDLALFSAPRARLWECCRTGGRRLLGCDDERMRFVSLSLSFSSLLTELGAVAVPVESAAGPLRRSELSSSRIFWGGREEEESEGKGSVGVCNAVQ